jgi:hypothetical protein
MPPSTLAIKGFLKKAGIPHQRTTNAEGRRVWKIGRNKTEYATLQDYYEAALASKVSESKVGKVKEDAATQKTA